jgi:hypothetical protein
MGGSAGLIPPCARCCPSSAPASWNPTCGSGLP